MRYLMIAVIFRDRAAQEHQKLLECALKRDAKGAQAILATHIMDCVAYTLSHAPSDLLGPRRGRGFQASEIRWPSRHSSLKVDHLEKIRLGLIGDNIAASRAPDLHHAAARLCGIDVAYERLVPQDLGLTFDQVVARAKVDGLRGLNITHPYKEQILKFVGIEDPALEAIGACNTVLFGERTTGFNTDYTGYIAAFKGRFGDMSPGAVAMAGSGGAGKAIAFALAKLGATSLRVFDVDGQKSQRWQKLFTRASRPCPYASRRHFRKPVTAPTA